MGDSIPKTDWDYLNVSSLCRREKGFRFEALQKGRLSDESVESVVERTCPCQQDAQNVKD